MVDTSDSVRDTEPGPVPRTGGWRRSAPERIAVLAVAAAAAVAGALSDCQPTGLAAADAVLTGGALAIVTIAGASARRSTWLVLAGTACFLASVPGLWLAFAATTAAFLAVALDRRPAPLGALVAAAAAVALLETRSLGPHGTTALISGAAALPMLRSGYRNQRRRTRARIRLAGFAVVGAAAVATGIAGGAVLLARSSIERAVDSTRDGLEAAQAGDEEEATRALGRANRDFDRARSLLGGPMTAPARLVPVVGQHLHATATLSDEGARITATGLTVAEQVDYDRLKSTSGQVDVAAVRAVQRPLADTLDTLVRATAQGREVDSPWLLPPVTDRIDQFLDEVDGVTVDARLAAEGAEVAPGLLGAEGDRRYLVLFTTPAELRGLGGFVGNWAELTASNGKLTLSRSGRMAELRDGGVVPRTLTAPEDYIARYGRFDPELNPQDITFSPDFPTVAEVWMDQYPQSGGGAPIDGVMAVDPIGLAALLELTGPVQIEGYDQPLTSENAADLLLRLQYVQFGDNSEQRLELLDDAGRATFDRLTTADLPAPQDISKALAPVTRDGRLVFSTRDGAEGRFLERAGVRGGFPRPDGGDLLAITGQNSGNNKIDIFLHRSIRYDVRYDPASGAVSSTATVTLRNDAPTGGLPRYVIGNEQGEPAGTNRMYFSLYTPLQLAEVTIDGRPAQMEGAVELGSNVYSRFLSVPPQTSVELKFRLAGVVEGGRYRLVVPNQPTVNPDLIDLRVEAEGAEGGGEFETEELDRDLRFASVPTRR
jgi:hypothetical protein